MRYLGLGGLGFGPAGRCPAPVAAVRGRRGRAISVAALAVFLVSGIMVGAMAGSASASPRLGVTAAVRASTTGTFTTQENYPPPIVPSGISCPSTSECVGVGTNATQQDAEVFTTSDGGGTWVRQAAPPKVTGFTSVACTSTTNCTAVGLDSAVGGVIYGTTDGGVGWTGEAVPAGVYDFSAIACPAAATCFAVGSSAASNGQGVIDATTDGGRNWIAQTMPASVAAVNAIGCFSGSDCVATATLAAGGGYVSLGTVNGGLLWTSQVAPSGLPAGGTVTGLSGVACTTVATCFMVGTITVTTQSSPPSTTASAGIFMTTDGGVAWTTVWQGASNGATVYADALTAIACTGATTCQAGGNGTGTSTGFTTLAGGVIVGTSDGTTWTGETNSPLTQVTNVTAISCASATTCESVGPSSTSSTGSVFGTTNGTAWSAQTMPPGVAAIEGVSCPTPTDCFAAGSGTTGGLILSTSDGGTTWTYGTPTYSPASQAAPGGYSAIACPTVTNCIAATSFQSFSGSATPLISSTQDGGASWVVGMSVSPFSTTFPVVSALTCAGSSCWAVGQIYTAGSQTSVAGIWVSTDGGTKWAAQVVPSGVGSLSAISCPTANVCVAGGMTMASTGSATPTAVGTTDGGTTWTQLTLPTSLLSISDVGCMTATRCVITGISMAGQAILVTTDGGTTWTQATAILDVTSIVEMACPAAGTCFGVGQGMDSTGKATADVVFTIDGGTSWEVADAALLGSSLDSISCATGTSVCAETGANGNGGGLIVSGPGPGFLPPEVTAISPTTGPAEGGTQVTITGVNFASGDTVAFGGRPVGSATVVSSSEIQVLSAPGTGTVDVTVTGPAGTSPTSSADQFTYITSGTAATVTALSPVSGPAAGGTTVTVTGTGFSSGDLVYFGPNPGTGVTAASSTQLTVVSPAGSGTVDVVVANSAGPSATSKADKFVYVSGSIDGYHPLAPSRICDTRAGQPTNQCSVKTLGAGGIDVVTVAGQGGVPSSGATAAVLNVTATNTTARSYFTVYPDGQVRPTASSLNFLAGQNVPNLVTVALPTDGQIDVYNAFGSADLIIDVQGYYGPEDRAGAGLYNALPPSRICDTRSSQPQNPCTGQAPAAGSSLNVQVTGLGQVPAAGVAAVVLNVTAIQSSHPGYLTVYPQGGTAPTASNVNYRAGEIVPNRVMVPVSSTGQISIYSGNGSPEIAVDVSGYFTDSSNPSATGETFTPAPNPVRICDTRTSQIVNQCTGQTLTTGASDVVAAAGEKGVPASAAAVVLNVTAADESSHGYLTVYPSGITVPVASDLNFTANDAVANMTVATLGSKGEFDVFNSNGSAALIVDLVGWYS